MNLIKIGQFIKECRKNKGLTQEQLATKLNVSFKTISRWECGSGLPDVSVMIPLCDILSISVNELLSGHLIDEKEYKLKAEHILIDLKKDYEKSQRYLLLSEIFIIALSIIILLASAILSAYLNIDLIYRIFILSFGIIVIVLSSIFCLLLEQNAGYYKCEKCGHIYTPTFKQVIKSMHKGRTRYMTCPKCHQKSWQRKVKKIEDLQG